MEWGQWSTADRVVARFRGSEGDQLRKGALFARARKGPPRPVEVVGSVIDLLVGLLSCYMYLPPSAPLVALVVVVAGGLCGLRRRPRGRCGRWFQWRECSQRSMGCTL